MEVNTRIEILRSGFYMEIMRVTAIFIHFPYVLYSVRGVQIFLERVMNHL